jgi:hypothetical protein
MDVMDKAISFNKDYVFLSEVMTYEINTRVCRNNFWLRENMNIDHCFIHSYIKFGCEFWKIRNSSIKCQLFTKLKFTKYRENKIFILGFGWKQKKITKHRIFLYVGTLNHDFTV